jgi:acetolactate synthase-1/2/3 large subunit
LRGADCLAATLRRAGVTTIFSLSGNQIMPVYDAALDHALRIVHTRHEAGAVFMAEGWAQASGQIGVALVTAAPGFANALGALYSARMSETPVLFLSGDASVGQDGKGAFQEFNQVAAATPFVKLSRRCMRAEDMAADVAELIRVARSGRPGPVHLALPADVLTATAEGVTIPGASAFAREASSPASAERDALADLLRAASRPIILTGPMLNATRGGGLLERLADAADAPVVPMESPRGLRDPSLGAFADALREADLIVYLGKHVDFTSGFGSVVALGAARAAVVDPDEAARGQASRLLGDRLVLTVGADADTTAAALIEAAPAALASRSDWRARVGHATALRELKDTGAIEGIGPQAICAALERILNDYPDAMIAIDGGEFGQWAQAFLPARNRLINGTSGAIGGSLPQAIGAKLARPDAPVFTLFGDGTAGFYFMEFDTAARANAPVIAIIGNDARWNAEHLIQLNAFGPDRLIGCELNPDARYDLSAAAVGCHGEYVTEAAGLVPAIERAVASGKPACINVAMEGLPAPVFASKSSSGSAH